MVAELSKFHFGQKVITVGRLSAFFPNMSQAKCIGAANSGMASAAVRISMYRRHHYTLCKNCIHVDKTNFGDRVTAAAMIRYSGRNRVDINWTKSTIRYGTKKRWAARGKDRPQVQIGPTEVVANTSFG
jgi:hypothetical protein